VQSRTHGKRTMGKSEGPLGDPVTLGQFLSDLALLSTLLAFLSFYDWSVLVAVSKEICILLVRTKELKEAALERFLCAVGYSCWSWDDPEPLLLSLHIVDSDQEKPHLPICSHKLECVRICEKSVHISCK